MNQEQCSSSAASAARCSKATSSSRRGSTATATSSARCCSRTRCAPRRWRAPRPLRIEAAVDVVVGPALGARRSGPTRSARALGVRALLHRARSRARPRLRRGFELEPRERVLVVEDVVTTGGSAREVIELVRRAEAEAVGVAAIVNRSGCSNPFEDLKAPVLRAGRGRGRVLGAPRPARCAPRTRAGRRSSRAAARSERRASALSHEFVYILGSSALPWRRCRSSEYCREYASSRRLARKAHLTRRCTRTRETGH